MDHNPAQGILEGETPISSSPVLLSSRTSIQEDETAACGLVENDSPQGDTPPQQKTINGDVEKLRIGEDDAPEPGLSAFRQLLLITLLCSAQFFDIFNATASLIALPDLGAALGFASGSLQWVISAYTLTFASLQLVSGRLTDVYHPKPVFVAGYATVGLFGIACGFSVNPIMLIVFRALQGIGAAMTIPSAISMITTNFRDPKAQSRVLSVFAAFGAIGNSLGFVIGGVLTARLSWRWVFWIVSIIVAPCVILSLFVLPKQPARQGNKRRSIDLPGVGVLTAGMILFVYAVSDANEGGWARPQILVTLILSIILLVVFFFVEKIVKDPAVPPHTWTTKNFLPLFIFTLSIYWYFSGAILQLVQVFQSLWGWSPLSAAIHLIPNGVSAGIFSILTGRYGHLAPRRALLVAGQLLMVISSILYALADTPDKYWSYIFPAMVLGMAGLCIAYVGVNVAIMASAPKGEEGVISALMNTGFQLGVTVGLAVLTAVTLGINDKLPLDSISQFKGYAGSYWSLVALGGIMIMNTALFVH